MLDFQDTFTFMRGHRVPTAATADTTSANNPFQFVYYCHIDEVGLHVPLPAEGNEEGKGVDGLNTNLARRLILAFAATSLTYISILAFFGQESQMATSLSFAKVSKEPSPIPLHPTPESFPPPSSQAKAEAHEPPLDILGNAKLPRSNIPAPGHRIEGAPTANKPHRSHSSCQRSSPSRSSSS